jgi:hypothetical protein
VTTLERTIAWGVCLLLAPVACQTDGPSERAASPSDPESPPPDTAPRSAEDTASRDVRETDSADGGTECRAPNCVAARFRTPLERDCDTTGPDRPDRCGANPVSFEDWGPASAVSRIEFQSDRAQDCCFNLDDSADGSVDNAFGELVDALPIHFDRQIQANLAAGTFVALGEYQGLESLDRPETLEAINVYLGIFGSRESGNYIRKAEPSCRFTESACPLETTPGKTFRIEPTILDEGTHPEVHFSDPTIEGSTLKAGPAELVGRFNVPGLGRHSLRVRGATFEATIDREASSIENGIVVERSRVGGYVLVRDMLDLLNGLVSNCGCLGRPDEAVTYPLQGSSGDPDYVGPECAGRSNSNGACRVQCKPTFTGLDRCSSLSNVVCRRFSEFCLIVDAVARRADLDTDGDGRLDALSFGAIYEMTGARIDGVANYLRATDRRLDDGGRLEVDRVFTNQSGWLAAFAPSGDGWTRLGHARLDPGNHRRPTLDLSSVSNPRSIQLVPYADDGPREGTFEPEKDSQLRFFPRGNRIASQIRVTPP